MQNIPNHLHPKATSTIAYSEAIQAARIAAETKVTLSNSGDLSISGLNHLSREDAALLLQSIADISRMNAIQAAKQRKSTINVQCSDAGILAVIAGLILCILLSSFLGMLGRNNQIHSQIQTTTIEG